MRMEGKDWFPPPHTHTRKLWEKTPRITKVFENLGQGACTLRVSKLNYKLKTRIYLRGRIIFFLVELKLRRNLVRMGPISRLQTKVSWGFLATSGVFSIHSLIQSKIDAREQLLKIYLTRSNTTLYHSNKSGRFHFRDICRYATIESSTMKSEISFTTAISWAAYIWTY